MMAVDLRKRDQSSPPPLLRSQFFTEDQNNNIIKPMTKNYSSCFSTSSDFGSILSSSVESEQGSTESESDQEEDDYIGELTRKMAHYMLQDDENVNRDEEEAWSAEWPKLGMKEKFEDSHKIEALSKKPTTPNFNFHSKQALIDEQIQLYKLKQEQFMKQQQLIECYRQFYTKKGRVLNGFGNGQQQHRTGSEMTAVFLGESGSKSGSCGTGVFLPRGITNPSDSRKKPAGCSPVLIPARVVHALKLQLDRMSIEPRFNGSTFHKQNDGMNGEQQFEKKSQSQTVPAMNNQEIGLPKEWTY